MTHVVLADASGLIGIHDLVVPGDLPELFSNVTKCFDSELLRFPREVADDLDVLARDGFLAGWRTGLGDKRDKYTSDWAHIRPVMALVRALGYESGLETLDNRDPAILSVARMAHGLQLVGGDFSIVSTDVGINPLVPTMEQFCGEAGWELIDPSECATRLGLLDF